MKMWIGSKKILGVLAIAILILTACGLGNSIAERKPDDITEENLEYYAEQRGSSSVCVRTLIYPYNGEFILSADYFNCGNALVETRTLSEEETEGFLRQVNTVSIKPAKTEDTGSDGAYAEKFRLCVDGVSYSVGKIDFESLGIQIKDIHEVEYPEEEENNKFELGGMQQLQDSAGWKERPVFIGMEAFGRSVGEQIEERLGADTSKDIDAMEIGSLSEKDFTVRIKMKGGGSYVATVTYMGYVAEVEGE